MSLLRRGLRRWAAVAAALLMPAGPIAAQALLPVPSLTGHVIDQTGTLKPEQRAALEQTLSALEARKGTQLAVLMVATTAPEAIEPYALRVAEVWKLGRKTVDDGVIVVVAKDDRAVRIEVGYGLEGALTDAGSGRIIRETLLPRFKLQDYAGGLTAGVAQIIGVIDGEPLPVVNAPAPGAGNAMSWAPLLLVLALAVGGAARALLGKVPGAVVTGGVVAGAAWLLAGAVSIALLAGGAALLVTLLGGGLLGRGLLGAALGGRGGHGSGGGLGGGGWGGGGGGGFGGGGASGRW
jgi:uncharacterized protein